MKFGFGGITCQSYPGSPLTGSALYRQAIGLARDAERVGFDSVWVSEHHFSGDGWLPSLLPMCAALAASTSTIRVGTAVLLAPLHEPVRVAEDAAVVDLISGGRFELGLGLGFVPLEFEAFRVERGTRVRRLEDTVATLRQAWAGEATTGGSHVTYPGMQVTPSPDQAGGPPLWLGGTAERAIRRAGRLGDGFIASYITDSAVLTRQAEWAEAGHADAGRGSSPFRFSVSSPVFVWPDRAWETVREQLHYLLWKYDDLMHPGERDPRPPTLPPLDSEADRHLRENIICGDPETVTAALAELQNTVGRELEIIARMYFPGLDPGIQRETLEMFASEVIPALRRGDGEIESRLST
jgi:alkanesulfonate monooxygenase SsuD/methylene tetrahydromethanopterin reductase-like flavin-dependent oxidoreductase (luciferase family)